MQARQKTLTSTNFPITKFMQTTNKILGKQIVENFRSRLIRKFCRILQFCQHKVCFQLFAQFICIHESSRHYKRIQKKSLRSSLISFGSRAKNSSASKLYVATRQNGCTQIVVKVKQKLLVLLSQICQFRVLPQTISWNIFGSSSHCDVMFLILWHVSGNLLLLTHIFELQESIKLMCWISINFFTRKGCEL